LAPGFAGPTNFVAFRRLHGPYTNKGLLDADLVYPCTAHAPCLIDSITLAEHKKQQGPML
jgi:hypothetical protein